MSKRIIRISIITAILVVGMVCAAFAGSIEPKSIHFDTPPLESEDNYEEATTKKVYVKNTTVSKAESSNENVAIVHKYSKYIEVERQGGGECDITITCKDGKDYICHVTAEATPFELNKTSYTFDKDHAPEEFEIKTKHDGCDIYFKKVISSDTNVAKVDSDYYNCDSSDFPVEVVGPGSCILTITTYDGRSQDVELNVNKDYFKTYWKRCLKNCVYSLPKGKLTVVRFDATPGAKVKIKINGKTYNKKVSKNGSLAYNIKKNTKKGKKYRVTISKYGVKYTYKGKVIKSWGC